MEDVRAEFEVSILRVAQTDHWLREHPPTIEWGLRGVAFPPTNSPVDHPGAQAIASGRAQLVRPAQTAGFVPVSDLAWFAEAGIPAVIFGPGTGQDAHTNPGPLERANIEGRWMSTGPRCGSPRDLE